MALARGTAGTCFAERRMTTTLAASLSLSLHLQASRYPPRSARPSGPEAIYRGAFSSIRFTPPGGGLFAAACPHVAAGEEARGGAAAVFMSRPNQQLPRSARHAQGDRNNPPLFSRPPSPPEMALSLPLVRPGHCPSPRADLHSDAPPCPSLPFPCPSPPLPSLLISPRTLKP